MTTNPRALLRWRSWKYNRRLILEDNLAWMVCAVLGHRPSNTSAVYEPPQMACERCHNWLPSLGPQWWRCEKHGLWYALPYGSCSECSAAYARPPLAPLKAMAELRKAVGAVDPQADSTGKLSTRDV